MNHSISPRDTQAPSEKHLEDWLWEHPESLWTFGSPDEAKVNNQYQFHFRQYPLASGRPDLIGQMAGHFLLVVELKKGPVTYKALGQVLRYRKDLTAMLGAVAEDYVMAREENHEYIVGYGPTRKAIDGGKVRSILVGHGVEDDNLLLACESAGVVVMSYVYTNDSYVFQRLTEISPKRQNWWSNSDLHHLVCRLIRIHALWYRRVAELYSFDAVSAAQEYLDSFDGGAA
ncbi:MAG: hypothetical protein LC130_28600 [Bryobacterales bacterium]|nr:hypothetical protein [Bryobacterales bacterium]